MGVTGSTSRTAATTRRYSALRSAGVPRTPAYQLASAAGSRCFCPSARAGRGSFAGQVAPEAGDLLVVGVVPPEPGVPLAAVVLPPAPPGHGERRQDDAQADPMRLVERPAQPVHVRVGQAGVGVRVTDQEVAPSAGPLAGRQADEVEAERPGRREALDGRHPVEQVGAASRLVPVGDRVGRRGGERRGRQQVEQGQPGDPQRRYLTLTST